MTRIALTLLAATALASPSLAADMALRGVTKALPMEAPFSWTGFYIGANVGAGWGSNTGDLNALSIGGASVPLGLPLGQVTQNGFLGGGQAGYNYQLGDIVLGVEAEGDWTDIRGHAPCLVVLSCAAKHKWLADVAGRAGVTFGRTLVYLKGGYAWTRLDTDATLALGGATLTAPASTVRSGVLLGTGIEHAIGRGWSAKVEYTYIDFGAKALDVPVTVSGLRVPLSANIGYEQKDHLVKFGLNYRFGQ